VPEPFELSLELANVGSFADRRSPRVILAGVQGQTKALTDLATRVETWLASAGWPRERRGFHPHLTLARLPETLDDPTRQAVADLTTTYSAPPVDPWHVESVSLIQSRLAPGGARYERLAAFPSPASS
jgi:2'-5' RNA ligase